MSLRAPRVARDADLKQLCAALAGGELPADSAALLNLARLHRVDALLARRLGARDSLRAAAVRDLLLARAAAEICDAAAARGLHVLLIKGIALAYTVYPESCLRPKDDLDLLIRHEDVARAERMLGDIGYAREIESDSEVWNGQRHYTKSGATPVIIDVHWRAANPVAFSAVLPFENAWVKSVAVPGLGPHARTLDTIDSLLLACVHRVAHHYDDINLLWLWDIHLLASRLSVEESEAFASSAISARVARVCARSLALAEDLCEAQVPDGLMRALESAQDESSSVFVGGGGGFSPFDVARADLAALSGWRDRMALLREHLFPPMSYMRRRYPAWPAMLLPVGYLHRIVRGAPRWLRRHVHPS